MTPVLFIASAQHDAARLFYTNVMGFTVINNDPFAFEFDAAGTLLRVQKVDDFSPQPFTTVGWRVDDIATERDRLAQRGAEFVRFEGLDQDERNLWLAPSGALVCWFKDPDENTLSLTQWADLTAPDHNHD